MGNRLVIVAACMAVVLMAAALVWALAQPGPPGMQPGQGMPQGGPQGMGGFPGMGMGMMMPGWPPAPTPVALVADGVLYILCDGKVLALDAKTLQVIAKATYWERPQPQR